MRIGARSGRFVVLLFLCAVIAGCDGEVADGTAGVSWTPIPPQPPVLGDWPEWRPEAAKEFRIGRGKAVAKDNGVEIQIDYEGSNKPGPFYLIVDGPDGLHKQFTVKLKERGTIKQVLPLQPEQLTVCCYIGFVSVRNGRMVGMSNRMEISYLATPSQ